MPQRVLPAPERTRLTELAPVRRRNERHRQQLEQSRRFRVVPHHRQVIDTMSQQLRFLNESPCVTGGGFAPPGRTPTSPPTVSMQKLSDLPQRPPVRHCHRHTLSRARSFNPRRDLRPALCVQPTLPRAPRTPTSICTTAAFGHRAPPKVRSAALPRVGHASSVLARQRLLRTTIRVRVAARVYVPRGYRRDRSDIQSQRP